MKVKAYLLLALLILFLIPSAALANGVSPILNFFHKDTWLPASIVTLVIILVEGGLIHWRVRSISWARALWVSFLINLASSAVGSMLLLVFGRGSFFMWDTLSLVLPLFVITLASEIPLIHALLRKIPVSWLRASALGIGINLVSYTVVFAVEIGLLSAWISHAGHQDRKELADWQNPKLLDQVTGMIYATESKGQTHGLRVFVPQTQVWRTITNCPPIDPNKWDIAGRTCAFVRWNTGDWKKQHLVIARLPEFSVLREIGIEPFIDHRFDAPGNWQSITTLALSPDEKYIAILFSVADAVAYKDRSSYYALGNKCRVVVMDVSSGNEIARAPRWASEVGLCWSPDGRTVLFSSFDDEKLYETRKDDVRGGTGHGIGYYSKDVKFPRGIFAFSLDSGAVARFSDGHSPFLVTHKRQILVREGYDTLRMLDSSAQEKSRIHVPRLGARGAVVSPDGSLVVAEIWRRSPFHGGGVPILFGITEPDKRHALPGSFSYRYDWTDQ